MPETHSSNSCSRPRFTRLETTALAGGSSLGEGLRSSMNSSITNAPKNAASTKVYQTQFCLITRHQVERSPDHELPRSRPTAKTSAPATVTCTSELPTLTLGKKRQRTHAMATSSMATTTIATVRATRNCGMRNGNECILPPRSVPAPVINPRRQGPPRPVSSPSSESASETAMLMAAPRAAERPTSSATCELPVERAAAKSGAMVEMEPSESPSNAGWPVISRKSLRPLRDASVPPPEAGGYCMPISLLPSDNIMVSAADQSAKGANPIRKGPLRPRPAVSAPKDRARRSPLLWRGAAIFVSSSVAGRTIVTPPTLVLPEPSGGGWPARGKEDQTPSRGWG